MGRIPLADLFRRAVDVLDREEVRYFVYGGIAFPLWGRVVTTHDVDLVVNVDEREASRLTHALLEDGFSLGPNASTLLFIDHWTMFTLGGRNLDLALGITPYDLEALRRAVTVTIFDRSVRVATAEDLILYKLAAFRMKDLGHVDDIIHRQGRALDIFYLRHWADELSRATGKFEIPSTLEKMLSSAGLD